MENLNAYCVCSKEDAESYFDKEFEIDGMIIKKGNNIAFFDLTLHMISLCIMEKYKPYSYEEFTILFPPKKNVEFLGQDVFISKNKTYINIGCVDVSTADLKAFLRVATLYFKHYRVHIIHKDRCIEIENKLNILLNT